MSRIRERSCPTCEGTGYMEAVLAGLPRRPIARGAPLTDCLTCNGTGGIPAAEAPGPTHEPSHERESVETGPDACDRCHDGIGVDVCDGCGRLLCDDCLGDAYADPGDPAECTQCREEGAE